LPFSVQHAKSNIYKKIVAEKIFSPLRDQALLKYFDFHESKHFQRHHCKLTAEAVPTDVAAEINFSAEGNGIRPLAVICCQASSEFLVRF
jgi:hypothetical protein